MVFRSLYEGSRPPEVWQYCTFLVSGMIHEYVNLIMFSDDVQYRFQWKQMLFFTWVGMYMVLEHFIGHWSIFRWMSDNLPRVVVTFLLICSSIPFMHLTTGDCIQYGLLDSVSLALPIFVCRSL